MQQSWMKYWTWKKLMDACRSAASTNAIVMQWNNTSRVHTCLHRIQYCKTPGLGHPCLTAPVNDSSGSHLPNFLDQWLWMLLKWIKACNIIKASFNRMDIPYFGQTVTRLATQQQRSEACFTTLLRWHTASVFLLLRREPGDCNGLIVPGPPSRSLFVPLLSSAAQTRAGDSDLHA
eukprot:scaffold1145_cov445-Pavlova_lutheri.AAC.1